MKGMGQPPKVRLTATIGCCGIDCGLCPRMHTQGTSRCPGCGGEGFGGKHPSCGFLTCCTSAHRLAVCAECEAFPCPRFDRETGEHDSFVTHRRVMANGRLIREIGIEAFLDQQQARIKFLQTALATYDDGRSKNLFCLAAALLTRDSLDQTLARAGQGEPIKAVLAEYAALEGQALRLQK